MRRSLLVATLAVLLVVQPATAANYPSAEAACGQTSGETLVAVFPGASELRGDGSQVVTGDSSVGVYPGTEFRVALCKDGDLKHTRGTEWSLESSSGLTVTARDDATATVRVTDATDPVDVVAEQKNLPGIELDVRRPATAEAAVTDDPITLGFEDAAAAERYDDAEAQYLAARRNLTAATDRLNESAEALRSGEGNASAVTETLLPALNQSAKSVEESASALKATLYDASYDATRPDSRSNALTALEEVRTDERAVRSDAVRGMETYLGALRTAERNAETTVLVNLAGAAAVGLLVGAVPGGWLTKRKLDGARFDQEVNASVSTGPRTLVRAGVLAAVALAVTVAALVATGGLGRLGGLL